jgi:hypothetical protein
MRGPTAPLIIRERLIARAQPVPCLKQTVDARGKSRNQISRMETPMLGRHLCLLCAAFMALIVSRGADVEMPNGIVLAQESSAATAAQSTPSSSQNGIDQDVQLLRQDIRSKKKQLVASNLKLSDSEATKFWPVYDRYTADLVKINDEKYALIKEYSQSWGTMTDEQALSMAQRALNVDQQVSALRVRYLPEFEKVIDGKKVATFFQIERQLQAMIDLQIASQLPLVQDQD